MQVPKPYRRTCRPFVGGGYAGNQMERYIWHPRYAQSPGNYIRAFMILLKDMQELFDYVEPADKNLGCYSYRMQELLLRACVEIEANCRAILTENGYSKTSGHMSMDDYKKIDASHRLSSYTVKLPVWGGAQDSRTPFSAWTTAGKLPWYGAYHAAKHDRHNSFESSTLQHMTDAMCGLVILLSSQFLGFDFGADNWYLCREAWSDGMQRTVGNYFRIRYPRDWSPDEHYDLDWQAIDRDPDPFQEFPYPPN